MLVLEINKKNLLRYIEYRLLPLPFDEVKYLSGLHEMEFNNKKIDLEKQVLVECWVPPSYKLILDTYRNYELPSLSFMSSVRQLAKKHLYIVVNTVNNVVYGCGTTPESAFLDAEQWIKIKDSNGNNAINYKVIRQDDEAKFTPFNLPIKKREAS